MLCFAWLSGSASLPCWCALELLGGMRRAPSPGQLRWKKIYNSSCFFGPGRRAHVQWLYLSLLPAGLKLASAGLPGSNAFARQVEPPSPPSAAGAGTSWTQSGGGPHCTAAELDAAGLAAAGFGSSPTGLRSLQRLELCVVQMMRSTVS